MNKLEKLRSNKDVLNKDLLVSCLCFVSLPAGRQAKLNKTMPEIIEAEITKQKLTLALKGKRILNFYTDWPRGLYSQAGGVKKTAEAMKGLKIQNIDRQGKVVVLHLESNKIIALHQRMSGHVRCFEKTKDAEGEKHARFTFALDDGSCFSLIDPRKFGTMWFGSKEWFEKQPYIKKLGKDILEIEKSVFLETVKESTSGIKSFLLRQDKLAGFGNIACDETLWRAKINPRKKVYKIKKTEAEELYAAMHITLADVLRNGGTSMSDWYHPDGKKGNYQDKFKIYSRTICPRCNSSVKRETVAGRGTYFCPLCQK